MKKITVLFNINDISFTAALLLIIGAFVPAELILRLTSPSVVALKGIPCCCDAFIIISSHSVWLYILAFVLFYTLYLEKYQLNPAVVIRKRNIKNVWKDVLSDLIVIDTALSLFLTAVTFIAGLLMTDTLCNWDLKSSRAYKTSGCITENPPNVFFIMAVFLITVFTLFFVTGGIMMFIWWLTKLQWTGFIAVMILIGAEGCFRRGFLWSLYNITYDIYKNGISIIRQIIYPVVLCIAVYAVSMVLVRRKDFLG